MQRHETTRRNFMTTMGMSAAGAALAGCAGLGKKKQITTAKPNVIIIFADDQGYADVGCFGARGFETPNIDRLAKQGTRFTNFHSSQPVCTASRAGLLTGCYPNRIGLLGALGPKSQRGIHENEMTLGEVFKQRGYATAVYGKWHLGLEPKFLPTRHGFDDYFGLPYSNDMWPFHPEAGDHFPPLPLIEREEIIALNPDQSNLTTWYTEHAVKFIEDHKDRPFFLYVPHSMPHVPLFVSDKFKGKSEQGMYGDVIMEIDWSVGRIMTTLKRLGLEDNTLVIYTSDNGPWLSYGDHAGSAGPLREGKGTTWDGGHREPCIMRWPGNIPAGESCSTPLMSIDLLPTLAKLINAQLPEHTIDGKDVWPILSGQRGAKSPHDAYYFYWGDELQAVLSGKWKLHFPHEYRTLGGHPGGTGGIPAKYLKARTRLALYDLNSDIGERNNVALEHARVVEKLSAMGLAFDRDLKANSREPGRV